MASGASGAELANIVNEAALRAIRDNRKYATQSDLEESIEVVIAGYQKKNAILTDKEKWTVAYHERSDMPWLLPDRNNSSFPDCRNFSISLYIIFHPGNCQDIDWNSQMLQPVSFFVLSQMLLFSSLFLYPRPIHSRHTLTALFSTMDTSPLYIPYMIIITATNNIAPAIRRLVIF